MIRVCDTGVGMAAGIGVESKAGQGSVFTVRLPPEYVVGTGPVALLDNMAWHAPLRAACVG